MFLDFALVCMTQFSEKTKTFLTNWTFHFFPKQNAYFNKLMFCVFTAIQLVTYGELSIIRQLINSLLTKFNLFL